MSFLSTTLQLAAFLVHQCGEEWHGRKRHCYIWYICVRALGSLLKMIHHPNSPMLVPFSDGQVWRADYYQ